MILGIGARGINQVLKVTSLIIPSPKYSLDFTSLYLFKPADIFQSCYKLIWSRGLRHRSTRRTHDQIDTFKILRNENTATERIRQYHNNQWIVEGCIYIWGPIVLQGEGFGDSGSTPGIVGWFDT